MSTISAGTTTPTALSLSGDTTGALTFQVNGTTTAATLNTSGNLLVGTTSAISTSTARLQVAGSGVTAGLTLARTDAPTSGASFAAIDAWSSDGSAYVVGGTINFRAAENWTSTNHGTDIQFRATASGSGGALFEAMRITSAGNVGIGTASPSVKLHIVGAVETTFAPNVFNQRLTGTSSATSGNAGSGISFAGYTTGTSTVNDLAFISGIKENTTDTNYAGALVFGTRTNGSGGGSFERMRIDSSGNVGIGGTASATDKVTITGTLPSSSNFSLGNVIRATIPSTSTSGCYGFATAINTQAASFTTAAIRHFSAEQGTLGASSAVTNQYGFVASSNMTGATNNFGFYSDIASGSNRWNFYAGGTARNYFAGNTGIGTLGGTTVRLWLVGSDATSSNFALYADNSASTTLFFVRNDGLFRTGSATFSPYNYTTGNAANLYVNADGDLQRSTSSLRYKSDVADAAHGLADVLKLRSVTYKATNSGETVFGGLIAEEVHDAGLTEFVAYDNEGRPDALHYGNMVALAFKAIQELKAENDALKVRIEALESK